METAQIVDVSTKIGLLDGVSVQAPDAETLVFTAPGAEVKLRAIGELRQALLALEAGATEDDLLDLAGDAQPHCYALLSRLTQRGLIGRSVWAGDRKLATATPISRYATFDDAPLQQDVSYVLSRFAYLRRENNRMVLEAPTCHSRIVWHDEAAAALVTQLGLPRKPSELEALALGSSAWPLLALLKGAGFVAIADESNRTAEDHDVALRQWEFHDLLFHARSRSGRHAEPLGGTFPFKGELPPLPALKAPMSELYIDLFKPDLAVLEKNDPPFAAVMARRASIRADGDVPISARELGEFLYRSARVVRQVESESGEYAFRPFPGGGGEYELELYLTISRCDGIAPGLYHYAPLTHRLYLLQERNRALDTMLGYAMHAGARPAPPQVMITYAARFQRVSWKYQSLAYAIILKDVGVLIQTMYLVATAMNLAPCAIGAGDADLFSELIKSDYYEETSVGEFLLGSAPSPNSAPKGASLADTARFETRS